MDKERQAVLCFQDVYTGYPGKAIIQGFTAQIYKGEFVGLIGPNGTGKSTLIKCVSGLLPITGGRILINGDDNATLSQRERARRMAVVPQSFGIDYDFSTEDIVMMGRNPYLGFRDRESEKDHAIVAEAMAMTRTDQFKGRLFNELSGGEKQRVIIARAIAQQSDLILLDEPTSALDMNHQIAVMELILRLNREQGKTVVAVLHDLNLAARYCDRLIMLENGVASADGTPEEIISENNMQRLYHMKMLIRNNPVFNKPEVVPIRVWSPPKVKKALRIHVIGGADGATRLMGELHDRGYTMTAGVLPRGCDDWLMGKALEIDMVEIPPFTGVSDEDQQENLKLIHEAQILLVADMPFGNGNIKNLEGIETFEGKIVIHQNIIENDFTPEKRVSEIVDGLTAAGKAVVIEDNDAFLKLLETWQET